MVRGKMTYFQVGLGACGYDDTGRGNSDYIVALSASIMGSQSNDNPFCGKPIEISANGIKVQGIVRDKCPSCGPEHIDVSEALFDTMCGQEGRAAGSCAIEWSIL
jgi:hypothetical protein